jgi:hypothetical protein
MGRGRGFCQRTGRLRIEGSRAQGSGPLRILGVLALYSLVLSVAVGQQDSTAAPADSLGAPAFRIVEGGPVSIAAVLLPLRETKELTVGDRFKVELTVRRHRDINVSEPMPESIGAFVVLDHDSKTRYEGDTIVDVHTLEMAAFATGELELPRFLVAWQEDDEMLAARTDSVGIKVASTLPEDMEDIHDIKPQIPFPNLLPLWIALGVVGAGGLGLLGWRLFRRWRAKRLEQTPLPEPWEEALAALEALNVKELLSAGLIKRYYYALSEILKRYLTRRYGFPAIDQTTSEMVLAMKRVKVDEREDFVGFFRRADLVKYAKLVPPYSEMEGATSVARDLVNRTTPEEEGPRIQGSKDSSDPKSRRPSNPRTPEPSNPS